MPSKLLFSRLPWLLLLLSLYAETASSSVNTATTAKSNRIALPWRGGGTLPQDAAEEANTTTIHNATVEAYVAAMKERDNNAMASTSDRHDDMEEVDDNGTSGEDDTSAPTESASAPDNEEEDPAVVGVKSHHSSSKKSNAVGDPDGDDDDDDDTDDILSELSDEWEEMEEFVEDLLLEPQLQVEVELVEEESTGEEADEEMSDKPSGGGGVGVRLGRMNNHRRGNRRNSWRSSSSSSSSSKLSQDQKRLLEAWTPHVYFPPTPSALAYLTDHARFIDASSKNRLDRRTLYAALLIEWGSVETKSSSRSRKFLPASTSQALQAALSMATQPQWRQSAPRTSGVRLYQDEEATSKTTTLSMQETVAMALVCFCYVLGHCRFCKFTISNTCVFCVLVWCRLIPWGVDY